MAEVDQVAVYSQVDAAEIDLELLEQINQAHRLHHADQLEDRGRALIRLLGRRPGGASATARCNW